MDEDFDFDLSELPVDEQLSVINDIIPYNLKEIFGNNYKENVVVKRSTIIDDNGNSIGLGLFATKNIRDNAFICIYEGVRISSKKAKERSYISDYVASLNDKISIDAKDPFSCFARYINDGMTEQINNSNWSRSGGLLKIKATRNIKKGEEIFITYGTYWLEKEKFEKLTPESRLLLYNDDRDKEVKKWIDDNYLYSPEKNQWYKLLTVNSIGQKILIKI